MEYGNNITPFDNRLFEFKRQREIYYKYKEYFETKYRAKKKWIAVFNGDEIYIGNTKKELHDIIRKNNDPRPLYLVQPGMKSTVRVQLV